MADDAKLPPLTTAPAFAGFQAALQEAVERLDLTSIGLEVVAEVIRAREKHGKQADLPLGFGAETFPFEALAALLPEHIDWTRADALAGAAKAATDSAARRGCVTWKDIILEEVLELFEEDDPEKQVAEALQAAAMLISVVQIIREAQA